MLLSPYITFQGNAKEAAIFYSKVLKTEAPDIMLYKEMPPNPHFPVADENKDWVMHGSINYNGQYIMFSDVLPTQPFTKGNNISLLIDLDDVNALKVLFDAFSEGGQITMPFEETFWAKGYGALIDKYGIEWQFNCSPAE